MGKEAKEQFFQFVSSVNTVIQIFSLLFPAPEN